MSPLPADAATLIAEGFGDRRLAGALGITRHAARALIVEAKLAAAPQLPANVPAIVPGNAMSLYDTACTALAEAVRVDEVKAVHDVTAAIAAYARRAKNHQLLADAVSLREHAERKLGEKLIEAKRAGQIAEGRPKAGNPQTNGGFPRVTLEDVGIDYNLSSRAQKKAAIAEQAFEAMIDQMRESIVSGRRAPDILKSAPINGARSVMATRVEPDDSLDFFPTPPWATRALMEVVLPHAGVHEFGTVWEPACGEGHISKVLSEYWSEVYASDVFDYGIGADRLDFLKQESMPFDPAWIVTNPPFTDGMAERFTLRAIACAPAVAMFVRSQWAVEGGERYETIFRPHPPTLCAFFSERVNLAKGRWDPDGSTATAYAWLVWINGRAPMPPLWIPPGQRQRLTKPDDRARFAAWSLPEAAHHAQVGEDMAALPHAAVTFDNRDSRNQTAALVPGGA